MAIVDSSLKNRTAWRLGYLVAALGIYLMDQASKAWAVRRLRFADRTIIRGFLDLVYAVWPLVLRRPSGSGSHRGFVLSLSHAAK